MIIQNILNTVSTKILRAWLTGSNYWNNRRTSNDRRLSNNRPFWRRKKIVVIIVPGYYSRIYDISLHLVIIFLISVQIGNRNRTDHNFTTNSFLLHCKCIPLTSLGYHELQAIAFISLHPQQQTVAISVPPRPAKLLNINKNISSETIKKERPLKFPVNKLLLSHKKR